MRFLISGLHPFTPKIILVILLTVCHTVLVMLVWRNWYWINLQSPNWYFSLFSSLVCLILYWYVVYLKSKQQYGNWPFLINFEKQKHIFSASLKQYFFNCSQFHNVHVNTTAIHKVNKDLMLDMLSWHQNCYIQKDLCLVHSKFPAVIIAIITVCFFSLSFK